MSDATRRAILSRMAAAAIGVSALVGSAVAAEAATHPDAELLALIPETDRLVAELEASADTPDDEQDQAAVDDMHDRFTAQMRKISSIQATTLDGLKFKASLYEYCDGVQLSLMNDLLAL